MLVARRALPFASRLGRRLPGRGLLRGRPRLCRGFARSLRSGLLPRVPFAQVDRILCDRSRLLRTLSAGPEVDRLDEQREAHGEVDVALGDVAVQTFENEA